MPFDNSEVKKLLRKYGVTPQDIKRYQQDQQQKLQQSGMPQNDPSRREPTGGPATGKDNWFTSHPFWDKMSKGYNALTEGIQNRGVPTPKNIGNKMFKYNAVNNQGAGYKGYIEGKNRKDALARLKKGGLWAQSLQEVTPKAKPSSENSVTPSVGGDGSDDELVPFDNSSPGYQDPGVGTQSPGQGAPLSQAELDRLFPGGAVSNRRITKEDVVYFRHNGKWPGDLQIIHLGGNSVSNPGPTPSQTSTSSRVVPPETPPAQPQYFDPRTYKQYGKKQGPFASRNLILHSNLIGNTLNMPRTAAWIRQASQVSQAAQDLVHSDQDLDPTVISALQNSTRGLLAATDHLRNSPSKLARSLADEIERDYANSLSFPLAS